MPKDSPWIGTAPFRHAVIDGTPGNDSLVGIAEDDVIRGLAGDDVLEAGTDGSDDTLDGGAGADRLTGNAGDNALFGGAGADTLDGSGGTDTLAGGAGDDVVIFSSGGDTYHGGDPGQTDGDAAGFDIFDMSGWLSGATVTFFRQGDGQISGTGFGGTFSTFDVFEASQGSDTIRGSSGDDVIDGNAGNDRITAAAGDDSVTGGSGDDTLVAGPGADTLEGGAGADVLSLEEIDPSFTLTLSGATSGSLALADGGLTLFSGIETIAAGDGGATLALSGGVGGALLGGAGDDSLTGADGDDDLAGGAGDDTLSGGAGDDTLTGGAGTDMLEGGDGDDLLRAGPGDDTLSGGDGSDTVSLADLGQGFAVTYDGDGIAVTLDDGSALRLTGIEALALGDAGAALALGGGLTALAGGAGDDSLDGAGSDDVLTGAGGDDLLAGGDGDDRLVADAGSDTVSGGAGTDTLDLGARTAPVTLTMTGGGAGSAETGGDTVAFTGIEVVAGGIGADALAADDSGMILSGGLGGDALTGGAGDDGLSGDDGADTLAGGAGDDVLTGGAGDDVLAGGAGADSAVFAAALADVAVFATADGFRLVSAEGEDRVSGVERFRFADQSLTAAELQALATPDPGTPGAVPAGDTTPLTGVVAPVGEEIFSRADPDIGDALFGTEDTPLLSIDYAGDPGAIGLLPDGYAIGEGAARIAIENGIFLTTGGGPGTQNTSSSFGVDLEQPGDPLLDAAVEAAFEAAGGTNDAAVVTFTFDADLLDGAPTLALELFFGSDEYPEFADSSFVDIAAVYVNSVNYALFNNDPTQPLAIVGESINTPGNFFSNANNGFGIEYDGVSALLTVLAPVQAGTNTVVIGIADTGDSIYDSGLFIGNAGGTSLTNRGSFVNVTGTDENDVIDVNVAPQIVDLVGGADVVRGRLNELDGDIIEGWGDNDLLVFDDNVEASAISVAGDAEQAVVSVDLDGDGSAEIQTFLFANFSAASFVVTDAPDGGVTLRAVGVLPDPPVLLQGGDGAEALRGGSGDDRINGGGGADTIDGGEGADLLGGGLGDDVIDGDFGADRLGGGAGRDTLYGGQGEDVLGGGLGDDTLLGGTEDDRLVGGAGGDLLDGQRGDDMLAGASGHDRLYGGLGDDDLGGGTGRDSLYGGRGDDVLGGGEGDDLVSGGIGDDFLAGGGRDDVILGGAGWDTLNGGTGDDTLTGGAGADLFVFNAVSAGEVDTITDFEVGRDTIRLTGLGQGDVAVGFDILDDVPGVVLEVAGHRILLAGLIESDFDRGDLIFA